MFCLFAGGVCPPFLRQWNCIIQLWHYEHRKPSTVSASLAVIRTASKHLHNDLAKAIEALEQKKKAMPSNLWKILIGLCTGSLSLSFEGSSSLTDMHAY